MYLGLDSNSFHILCARGYEVRPFLRLLSAVRFVSHSKYFRILYNINEIIENIRFCNTLLDIIIGKYVFYSWKVCVFLNFANQRSNLEPQNLPPFEPNYLS